MGWAKNALLLVGLLVVIVVGLLLGIDNHTPLRLRLLDMQSVELAVFWWLYAAFASGLALGVAACFSSALRGKLNERRLKRALAQCERELARLQEGSHESHRN